MRRVAGRLGIDWAPSLLRPTFNGRPIGANSSDPTVQGEGILPERATAFSDDAHRRPRATGTNGRHA